MNATAIHRSQPGILGRAAGEARASSAGEAGVRLAAEVMLLPLGLLRSRLGRRLLATGAFALVLTTAVGALYDNADVPARAAARVASLQPAPAHQPAARTASAAGPARELGRRPEDVAANWFAKRQGVPRDRVQALQQQKVSSAERRVLVMADAGSGRLPTGYVTVRRNGSGWSAG
ncbi:MAG TPA: hypothetical protein VF486_24720 [Actinomycetes bacterium]